MRNYVAVVFDDTNKAYEGLHASSGADEDARLRVCSPGFQRSHPLDTGAPLPLKS
jgi:hypothetical protein